VRTACACPCVLVHRKDVSICQLTEPVTTRSFTHVAYGKLELQFCQPCADELDRQRRAWPASLSD
jgi:hypothetical protein